MRISLDGYDPKVRKVNRCRPTVSNKTILATKQKFCFTKAPPVQSITDIALLGFRLILHPGMFINFILHYHLFFRKEFFSNVYISVNTIFECSYLRNYNHFHNILRLFDVLTNLPFTISETIGNYYL